ncbi:acyltransferase family protein [Singulisphaera rosea]
MQTTSDAELRPLERDPRYRSLDMWRGVACLMVVLYHASFSILFDFPSLPGFEGWLIWGIVATLGRMNLGVPLFFVISGYCIAASVDATRRRGRSALGFLGRRLWRIYPPYWAAVAWFVAVTGGLDLLGLERFHDEGHALSLDSPTDLDAIQWGGNLTLTEQWRPLVWRPPYGKIFTRIAWSLCYEEQFYFVCFVVLLITPKRLYGALAAVSVAAILTRVLAYDTGRIHLIDGAFPYLWHEFAVGLAVYWRLNVAQTPIAKRGVEAALVILAAIGLLGYFFTPVANSTATSATFGLVLIALRPWDDRAEQSLWLGPLRACGRRCYSVYLVHLPVCTVASLWLYERGLTGFWTRSLVTIPAVVLSAVGVSWVFNWAVERHFLNAPIVARDPGLQEPHGKSLVGESIPQATSNLEK